MIHKRITRVDIQVSILTAGIVIITSGIIFAYTYLISYRGMIYNLKERVLGIYDYLETVLVDVTFEELNGPEDSSLPLYGRTKALLENIRETTGVRYLYTAKQAKDGSYIYVVDGLPEDSPDFRHIGDFIEPEIIPDIERALRGEQVFPSQIKDTSWGYIFISYLPIYSGGKIIGVVGVEFEAEHQYKAFHFLKWVTPLVILGACVLADIIALVLFRRISNPTFRDLANTDMLTGLKNRNAFETDVHNLEARGPEENMAILSADLDRLKTVNDTWGHQAGDRYIRRSGELLQSCVGEGHALYRVGGDEFACILKGMGEEQVEELLLRLDGLLREAAPMKEGEPAPSMSAGYAFYDRGVDKNLEDTFKRADDAMYEAKRGKKQQALTASGKEVL